MTSPSRRRARRPIDTLDYMAMLERMTRGAGRRIGEEDVEDLARLVEFRQIIDDAITAAVDGLRDSGYTWQQIGDATGTTRQAALMKWSRGSDASYNRHRRSR